MKAAITPAPLFQQVLFYLGSERIPVGVNFPDDLDPQAVSLVRKQLRAAWARLPTKVRAMAKSQRVQGICLGDDQRVSGRYVYNQSRPGEGRPYINLTLRPFFQSLSYPAFPNLPPLDYVLAHEIYGHGIACDRLYWPLQEVYTQMVYAPFPVRRTNSDAYSSSDPGTQIDLWVKEQLANYPHPPDAYISPRDNKWWPASLLLLTCNWRSDHYQDSYNRLYLQRHTDALRRATVLLCPPTWRDAWLQGRPLPKEVGDIIISEGLRQVQAEVDPIDYWRALKLQDATTDAYDFKDSQKAIADHLVAEAYEAGARLECERVVSYLKNATDAILAVDRPHCACGVALMAHQLYCTEHMQIAVCYICGSQAQILGVSKAPYWYNLCSPKCTQAFAKQIKIYHAINLHRRPGPVINAYGGVYERELPNTNFVGHHDQTIRAFDGSKIFMLDWEADGTMIKVADFPYLDRPLAM